MSNNQPMIEDSNGKSLACHAIALAAIIVDDDERILMLSHPIRNEDGSWEIVGGGLKREESVLEGTLREVHEEVGEDVQVRALGTVHVHTFYRDDTVQFNTGIYYLLAYHGGQVIPGGDMTGSKYRWWTLDEIEREHPEINTPRQQWILWRAIELYRLWKNSDIDLQPDRKLC